MQSDQEIEEWQRENDILNQEGFKVISGGWTPVGFAGFNLRALNKETWEKEEAERKAKEEEKMEAVSNGSMMH